jgi:hypothetical protein
MIKFLLSILRRLYKEDAYDKGRYLENLTYKSLRHFEKKGGKFLANLLIPKRQGGTTEIDLLLICSKGLFVFECKNYDGWIFGHEWHKKWTQTLPKGRSLCHKEHFYNPIMQNASHIKHLKNLIGKNLPMRSIIVFSDRCEFKNVTIQSNNISVIQHFRASSVISKICHQIDDALTASEINDIYSKLYPYTQD